MQTLTIQITSDNGLKALHAFDEKHHIRIIDDADPNPAKPSAAMGGDF